MTFSTYNDPSALVNHQVQHGMYGTGDKAILYVYSPRPFSVQLRRPLIYTFNDRFVNAAEEAIHGGVSGTASIDALLRDPNSMGAVMPSASGGIVTRMDDLSGYYTFLLIITGEQPNYQLAASGFDQQEAISQMNRLSNNRVIYHGVFLEEPMNYATMQMTQPTINFKARMLITHKTMISQLSSFGGGGYRPRYDVTGDIDVVHPDMIYTSSGDEVMHQNTPDQLLATQEASVDPYTGQRMRVDTLGDFSRIDPLQSAYGINTKYSVPHSNMKTVLRSVRNATDAIMAGSRLGSMSDTNPSNLMSNSTDIYNDHIIANMRGGAPLEGYGLQENQIYTLEMIDTKYNPTVVPARIELDRSWQTADQLSTSPANVFSSLIMQVGPVIMTNSSLSQISFQYDSYADALRVETFEPMMNASDAEKSECVRTFLAAMNTQLFPMMKAMRGDFRIHAALQSAGVSRCILNFYCDDQQNMVPFEVPTIAGGLMTNMVANTNMTAANGASLAMFVDRLSGGTDQDLGAMDYGQLSGNMAYSSDPTGGYGNSPPEVFNDFEEQPIDYSGYTGNTNIYG